MTTAVVDRISSVVNFRVSSCFVLVLVSVTFVLAALWFVIHFAVTGTTVPFSCYILCEFDTRMSFLTCLNEHLCKR